LYVKAWKIKLVRELNLLEYYSLSFPELADKLDREYYEPYRNICEDAIHSILEMNKTLGTQSPARIYTNFCLNLVFTIKHDITERQSITLPAARALHAKNEEGHDCANCKGACKNLGNEINVNAIAEANNVIIDSLCRLHKLAMPAYLYTQQPEEYKELRYKMLSVYSGLLELFYIEESVLFAAILQLQLHRGKPKEVVPG